MKVTRALAFLAFAIAMVMTGLGGLLDGWRGGGTFFVTKEHAWNDGLFLMLVSIFLLHL